MDILSILLDDFKDKKIRQWLNSEINGYDDKADVPEYRIIGANITGNYIVGTLYHGLKCTNQPIPIAPEYIEEYTKIKVTSGINEILQMSTTEKENKNHCLVKPIHVLLAQEISILNGEILSANQTISIYAFTNILNKLKSILIKIFKELENKYGNLDEYYIDFTDSKVEKEIAKKLINIIFDNSIHMGDKNKIESSNIGISNEN